MIHNNCFISISMLHYEYIKGLFSCKFFSKILLPLKKKFVGLITLKNIKIYAYHGCLVEEKKIGSDYRVDLKIKANLNTSAKSDNLSDTVDYVHLNHIVKEEMAIRSKLLEHAAERILTRILKELPLVNKATVDVSKINPPIGGNVQMVTITRSKKR